MIRITAPHFCAAIADGRYAPILQYMRGWSDAKIETYCKHKGWKLERLSLMVFKGFVLKLSEKSGRSAKGKNWTMYSAKIEKEDGSEYDKWVSFGFDKPNLKEGDYVKITSEANDRGYEEAKEVKRLKNAPARSGKKADGGASGNGQSTQKSIHYQNSRTVAVAVLQLLQSQDALPLSAAKTKAGEIKRYEEIMALVDKLTVRFFNDVETLRLLESVADEGAEVADGGKLPEDDEDDADEEDESDDEDDSDDEEEEDDE